MIMFVCVDSTSDIKFDFSEIMYAWKLFEIIIISCLLFELYNIRKTLFA